MKRILIVEDDLPTAAALGIRLKSAGYDALIAANGFLGLRLAASERPDVILMDVMMPVGMGFSVTERLREMGLHIPTIFLTASRRNGLRRTAQKLGAAGFFEKPYDAEELLAAIALVLHHGAKSTPAPRPPRTRS